MSKKKEKYKHGVTTSLLGGQLLGLGGSLAVTAPVLKYLESGATKENMEHPLKEKILNHFKDKHGLVQDENYLLTHRPGETSRYIPKSGANLASVHANALYGPEILAHEMGHAVDLKKHTGLKMTARTVGPILSMLGTSYLAGNDETRPYAAAALPVGFTPMLYQEAKASVIGHNALKNAGATIKELRNAKKTLGLAFGTYAGAALVPAAITHFLLNRKRKN